MPLSPTSKLRERLNQAIRAHVEMQLADQQAATDQRLTAIDEAVAALQATTGTLQQVTTTLSASVADRIRVVEQAVEQAVRATAAASTDNTLPGS